MKFGEPVLMGTRLDEKAKKELREKMISLREPKQKTEANPCKDSSTVNKKLMIMKLGLELMIKIRLVIQLKILVSLRLEKGEGGKSRRNKIWIKKLRQ